MTEKSLDMRAARKTLEPIVFDIPGVHGIGTRFDDEYRTIQVAVETEKAADLVRGLLDKKGEWHGQPVRVIVTPMPKAL